MKSKAWILQVAGVALFGGAAIVGLTGAHPKQQPTAEAAFSAAVTLPVYTDALVGDFEAWTWASNINLNATSPVYSGTRSMKLSISGPYGGVELHSATGVNAGQYPILHFAARASAAGGGYSVGATDVNDNVYANPVTLKNYGGDPVTTGWRVYNVPFASLGAGSQTVYSIIFQDDLGKREPAVYVDDVSAATSATPATPTATASPAPTKTPTVTPPPPTTGSARRVVAYYPLWIQDTFAPQNLDYSIVTHVIQSAIYPNANGSLNLTADGSFPNLAFVPAVHAGGAKALISVADNEGSSNFSNAIASAGTRQTFVTNVMNIVNQYGYDGVDLDWEFPASTTDRANLTTFVAQLRSALGTGRLLAIAAPTGDWAGQYYDIPSLIGNLDWLGAMTYDYAGIGWTTIADNNAPLYTTTAAGSVDATASYYLQRGVTKSKLLIGLPFYGREYMGASVMYGALKNQQGAQLDYTAVAGMIGNGWTVHRATTADVPYLLKTDGSAGVVSYDDATSIQAKCGYVVSKGLAGAIIWNVGQDGAGAAATQTLLEAARGCH